MRAYEMKVGKTYEVDAKSRSAFTSGNVVSGVSGSDLLVVHLIGEKAFANALYYNDGSPVESRHPLLDPKKPVLVFNKRRATEIIDDITSQLAELKELLNEAK